MEQINKKKEKYDWMVSYQWTGVSDNERVKDLEKIVNFFDKKNISIFCSDQFLKFFDLNKMGSNENYNFCLDAQNVSENILFFINAPNESTGMKKELTLSIKNNQKKILLIKKEFENLDWVQDFKKVSERIFVFNNFEIFDLEENNFLD